MQGPNASHPSIQRIMRELSSGKLEETLAVPLRAKHRLRTTGHGVGKRQVSEALASETVFEAELVDEAVIDMTAQPGDSQLPQTQPAAEPPKPRGRRPATTSTSRTVLTRKQRRAKLKRLNRKK